MPPRDETARALTAMHEPATSERAHRPAPSEAEQRQLEHVLVEAFLANVPDSVYFKDRDSRFIAVSKSKVARHRCARAEELLGKTDADFFSEAYARRTRRDELAIMESGAPMLGCEQQITWSDGRVSWVRTSKLPLRDAGGAIIGTFGLSQDITAAKEMEAALEKANKETRDASRLAGMAEVATGVLHNVGNVLNSLNVSAAVIGSGLRHSKAESLGKVSALISEHAANLGEFFSRDPKGRLVPEFLESLARHTSEESTRLLQEIDAMQQHIDHIKEIVSMQQAYATMVGIVEPIDPVTLMEDSLRMNSSALVRHDVSVVRAYGKVPPVAAERGKVLQILINLIRNAKYALDEGRATGKVITLRIEAGARGMVRLAVQDNGVGIPAENLTRIFAHGFTTRAHGHGFGLHSSALAAGELHGTLRAESAGVGLGATFNLELPVAAAAADDRQPPRSAAA
jgi:PAS domain S-box-containing protein